MPSPFVVVKANARIGAGLLVALLAICALLAGQVRNNLTMAQSDRAFVMAVAEADKDALSNLLDEEFTWTTFEGRTLSKNDVLRGALPRTIANNSEDPQTHQYTYGPIGDVQSNSGREHSLRVWVMRSSGWKLMVYQEVMSLEAAPTFAPGAGKNCDNPCKAVPYQAKNETERQVIAAYSKLETAAMAHNSAVFTTMVGDEFVAISSNSNKVYDKRGRLDDFNHSKNGGVAPTPLVSARLFDFSVPGAQSGAVLMTSEHKPDRGKPLHVTRLWAKRDGGWVETLSYQTSVQAGK